PLHLLVAAVLQVLVQDDRFHVGPEEFRGIRVEASVLHLAQPGVEQVHGILAPRPGLLLYPAPVQRVPDLVDVPHLADFARAPRAAVFRRVLRRRRHLAPLSSAVSACTTRAFMGCPVSAANTFKSRRSDAGTFTL